MRFFSYDGFLATAIRYIVKLFVLNLCYAICCIPVVTVGAATAAMHAVFYQNDAETGLVSKFFYELKANFRQATVVWLVALILLATLILDWYYLLFYQFAGKLFLTVVTVVITVFMLSALSFVFPLLARYENSTKQVLKNALLLGTGKFIFGVMMSAVSLLPFILFYMNWEVFLYVMLIWIPFGGCLSTYISGRIAKHVFRKMESV